MRPDLRGASPVRRLRVLSLIGAALVSAGCSPPAADTPDAHAIVTFQVAGGERFKVELIGQDLVAHAQGLLAGQPLDKIPVGTVVRDSPGPNAPWTWHLDPATIHFAFATTEVCDGIPSDVEKQLVTSPTYCPWSAVVVAVDPG